jgi:hypothetical protein
VEVCEVPAGKIPNPNAVPVRVREVPPDDQWLNPRSRSGGGSMPSPLVEAELKLPASERAQVLYFDLPRWAAVAGKPVEPVVTWAGSYRKFLPSREVPASLVAIGPRLASPDQGYLRKAVVYFLDESRPSFQGLMGSGPRPTQIYRLIQNLSGFPIAANADPYAATAAVPSHPAPLPPQGAPSGWDVYAQKPPHIDPSEVAKLFGLLSRKPEDWQRDY